MSILKSKCHCGLPAENKKYKLCKRHNWERLNPDKDFFKEQSKKRRDSAQKMLSKQRSKPKKEYVPKPIKKKPQKKIKKVSEKRQRLNREYFHEKKEYMKEKPNCEVFGCCLPATEIHHKKGKVGYADKWARDNNVPLLNDRRFFMSVCGGLYGHHRKIEDHPEWAKEMGYSLSRLENLDQ